MSRVQPESNSNRTPILLPLSVALGILAGFLGYCVGQYFYVLFIHPFVLLFIGVLLFFPALAYVGARRRLNNVLCGLLMGLTIFVTFHFIEYTLFRSKALRTIELSQHFDSAVASRTLDAFLVQKTGLSGFPGFMIYQQSRLRPYVYYFTRGGQITGDLSLYLHDKTAWLYLAGEALVLLAGMALSGFLGPEAIRVPWSFRHRTGPRPGLG